MISGATNKAHLLKNNIEDRIAYGKSRLFTGISYIDEGAYGIAKDDLLLIGAYSGSGKTELATTIALNNVVQGKKVFFYALEAAENEIENRLLYRLMCQLYFADKDRPRLTLSYPNWIFGKLPELAVYDLKSQKMFSEQYKTLYTFYKSKSFTIKNFITEFAAATSDGADLIIIDHAHYFDWGDRNENEGIKQVVTKARDLNLLYQVPVILISHLRKSDSRNAMWAPTQEDFHGSSELYKRCTKAILLGPGEYDGKSKTIETYINIAKARVSGESTRFTGRMRFSLERNEYEREYEIGRSNQKRDSQFKTLNGFDIPGWCRSARSGVTNQNASNATTISLNKRGNGVAQSLPYKD